MALPPGYIMVFGLPLVVLFGIVTFLCLMITALLGYLVLKAKYNIPFVWHMRMAAATVVFAVVHVLLVISLYW